MTSSRVTCAVLAATLLAMLSGAGTPAMAGVIDQIRANQAIRIAYREDAAPFSYKDKDSAQPAGFVVDLCQAVVKKLSDQLGVSPLKVTYVSVTSATRFEAIKSGQADLLCEASTETLARRKDVDFSIPTFADGASLLVTDGALRDLKSLSDKKIGVLAGTTTEDALRKALKAAGVTAEIEPAKTHAEGLAMLDDGKVSAYFADRSILMNLIKDSKDPKKLRIADTFLTVEPYALALPHGDDDFRLAVDTALSRIYASDDIRKIFEQTFGSSEPSRAVKLLYLVGALPD